LTVYTKILTPSWINHHRLLEPIGHIPPADVEANYYRQLAMTENVI
jgi:hypothetical protein